MFKRFGFGVPQTPSAVADPRAVTPKRNPEGVFKKKPRRSLKKTEGIFKEKTKSAVLLVKKVINFIYKSFYLKNILQKLKNWEAWPFNLIYAPLAPMWVWYMIKSKAVWFFTPSNPKLTFGGLEGEPKREMYDLLPLHLYPITINILPKISFEEVISAVIKSKIPCPPTSGFTIKG